MKLQNESKMNRKMIIFDKSDPSLAFAKMVIFTFIFTSYFSCFFKLRSDTHQQWRPPTSIPHTHHLPLLLPCPLLHQLTQPTITNQPHRAQTTMEVVWALGNVFFKFFSLLFKLMFSFAFLGFVYVIYHETAPRWHTHIHATATSSCSQGGNEQLARRRRGGCNDEKEAKPQRQKQWDGMTPTPITRG